MSKRPSRRKRLKRDPINQRPHRLRAWARYHGFGPAVDGEQHPPSAIGRSLIYGHKGLGRVWYDIYYRFYRMRVRKAPPTVKVRLPPPVDADPPIMVFTIGNLWG